MPAQDSLELQGTELPLLGKKILVTRPGSQGEYFAAKLAQFGAEPILMPMIEICSPDSWDELDTAIANIDKYQWLLFASSNAVVSFATRLTYKSQLAPMVKLPNIAVIGDTTAQSAQSFALPVNYCPNNFLAEDFIAQFPGYPDTLQNIQILWPRTNYGRDFIVNKLEAAGAKVHVVPAYKTELPGNVAELAKQLQALICSKQIDAITLASKQTAINLAKIISFDKMLSNNSVNANFISRNSLLPSFAKEEAQTSLKDSLQDILIVTIGPETSEGALNYLGKVDKQADQHNADGMINALIEHYK